MYDLAIIKLKNQIGKELRITEAQGNAGSRKWGIWKVMRLVLCDCDTKITNHRNKNIQVIEAYEVNAKNCGINSTYNKTFVHLCDRLKQLVKDDYTIFENNLKALPKCHRTRI